MRIGVVQFPGSNCERETILAIKRADMTPVEFLWNQSHELLRSLDGYVIVGGFSYEDRSRAGVIAALDPVMLELKAQSEQGKPILGICNGAQILVETGLVPGLENHKVGMALAENKRMQGDKIIGTGYYNAWVNMRLSDDYQRNAFTQHLTPQHIIHLPVAHGEGRFLMTDALYAEVMAQGLNLFQYCDAQGNIQPQFPINPNGSLGNMAAVSNKAGNVLAMMPHPERTIQGDPLFQSMRDYIQLGRITKTPSLFYYPRFTAPKSYQARVAPWIVELMITDNQASTVQNTLKRLGLAVTVKRFMFWEITASAASLTQIRDSDMIFNPRKERLKTTFDHHSHQFMFLVKPKEDLLSLEKLQALKNHAYISDVSNIQTGVLWQFSSSASMSAESLTQLKNEVLKTQIIYNPYAHEVYEYVPSL